MHFTTIVFHTVHGFMRKDIVMHEGTLMDETIKNYTIKTVKEK